MGGVLALDELAEQFMESEAGDRIFAVPLAPGR
jgi:hypothetical protein